MMHDINLADIDKDSDTKNENHKDRIEVNQPKDKKEETMQVE
jgi:hypothetical protein